MKPLIALYWYRHCEDLDQSVRDISQLMMGAESEKEALGEVGSLEKQGYKVQRIVLQTACLECESRGIKYVRPKGMRRSVAAKLPKWRLAHVSCKACDRRGFTEERELRLGDEHDAH